MLMAVEVGNGSIGDQFTISLLLGMFGILYNTKLTFLQEVSSVSQMWFLTALPWGTY